MTFFLTLALLLLAAPAPDQSYQIDPGDFRWVPLTVRQTPASITCRFEVLQGGATVHAELLPMSEFRLFNRGREHDTMAVTVNGKSGEFRRVIDRGGQYAVVIVNEKNGRPAVVSLHVETNVNPDSSAVARTLSPVRRFTVVLIGLGFFFLTAGWSSRKLIKAMRR
jgi:hypothetical protein